MTIHRRTRGTTKGNTMQDTDTAIHAEWERRGDDIIALRDDIDRGDIDFAELEMVS